MTYILDNFEQGYFSNKNSSKQILLLCASDQHTAVFHNSMNKLLWKNQLNKWFCGLFIKMICCHLQVVLVSYLKKKSNCLSYFYIQFRLNFYENLRILLLVISFYCLTVNPSKVFVLTWSQHMLDFIWSGLSGLDYNKAVKDYTYNIKWDPICYTYEDTVTS